MTVYIDVLFAVNFSMDFLALYVTAYILKIKFKLKRGILAALIGAFYGVVSVIISIEIISSLILTAIIGVIMCLILNGYNGLSLALQESTVFLASNLVIGGGMTAIYEVFNANGGADSILIYGNPETVEQQLPMALFIIGAAGVAILLLYFGRGINKHGSAQYVELHISHHAKKINITALSDSGNLLTEPISGLPVVILCKNMASEILSADMYNAVVELNTTELSNYTNRVRMVLYETVSGKGIIGAFKPDKITVNGIEVSAWVAVSDKLTLGKEAKCSAIIPQALVRSDINSQNDTKNKKGYQGYGQHTVKGE